LGYSLAAFADSTLEFRVTENGEEPGKLQSVQIKDGRILLKAAGGENLDLIYSTSPEQLSIIDHQKRTMMTLDENQVTRITQQVETVQPILQGFSEQIAKLTPKQRAKWEGILGGKVSLDTLAGGTQALPPASIIKTGKHKTVAGIACEQMKVVQGKTQTAELCLANAAKLKLAETDYTTLRALLAYYQRLVGGKAQVIAKQFGLNLPNVNLQHLQGIPVEMSGDFDKKSHKLRLIRILASAITAENMQTPDGYQNEPFKLW
jgi:hypothetical protein